MLIRINNNERNRSNNVHVYKFSECHKEVYNKKTENTANTNNNMYANNGKNKTRTKSRKANDTKLATQNKSIHKRKRQNQKEESGGE